VGSKGGSGRRLKCLVVEPAWTRPLRFTAGTTLYLGGSTEVFSLPSGAGQTQGVFATRGNISGMAGDASGVFIALTHSERGNGGFIVQLLK
jgi:hypothetical protein